MADGNGRVKAIEVSNSSNGQVENLPCGLLLYCIGFENVALDGVPADENGRLKMLDSIRVETDGKTLVYATGWCAHTPRGVIAHTQVCPFILFSTSSGTSRLPLWSSRCY